MLLDINWIERYIRFTRHNYNEIWESNDHNILKELLVEKLNEHIEMVEESQNYAHMNLWVMGTRARIMKVAGIMMVFNDIFHKLVYVKEELINNQHLQQTYVNIFSLERANNLLTKIVRQQQETETALAKILFIFKRHNRDENERRNTVEEIVITSNVEDLSE